jgi:hypothetical protein
MNRTLINIGLSLALLANSSTNFSQLSSDCVITESHTSIEINQNFNDELFQEILTLQKKINVIVTENNLQNKLADLKVEYSNDFMQKCPNMPDSDFTQIPMRSLHLWVLNFEDEASKYKGFLIEIIEKLTN